MILLCSLLLLVLSARAQEGDSLFAPLESQWVVSLGGEQLWYPVPWNYERSTDPKKTFKETARTLSGGRLGFGRQFHLAGGLLTTTKAEGYYLGTLFTQAQTADPAVPISVSETKRTGHLYGIDLTQSLGYAFEFKFRHILLEEMTQLRCEPFVEVGMGRGLGFNKLEYFDTRAGGQGYEHRFEDELLNTRLSVGFNLTSIGNYFMYARATLNKFHLLRRTSLRMTTNNGTVTTDDPVTESNVALKPIQSYALGGGYRF